MRRRLCLAAMAGGALAGARCLPAQAGEDLASRVAIAADEQAAVRAWLARHGALTAGPTPRPMHTTVSNHSATSTTSPDWLLAHAGPSTPPPPVDPAQLARGERLPVPVYRQGEHLPPELLALLPPQPRGTMLLRFDRRLVRVFRATRTVLDVVEL